MKPGRLFLTPILVLFLVLHSCNTGKDEPRTEVPSVVTAVPSIPYATDQTSFHEANLRFRDQLNLAKNDIQRSQLVNECDKARTKFFKDKASRIDNWIGKIEDIKSENNGEWAFVKIASDAAGFPISYQTHFERWSEWGDKSLLKKGTRSFQQVAQLSPESHRITSISIPKSRFFQMRSVV